MAARDAKGLYAKAARDEAPAMIGFVPNSPYEPPMSPDLIPDSAQETTAQLADRLTRFILAKLVDGAQAVVLHALAVARHEGLEAGDLGDGVGQFAEAGRP